MPILLNPEYSEGIPISITKKLFLNTTVLNTKQYIYCKESVTTDYKLTKRELNISCPKKVQEKRLYVVALILKINLINRTCLEKA